MTTLQDQPQTRSTTQPRAQQAGDAAETFQSQQQSYDDRQPAGQDRSDRQEETFTISADDWFKA